TSRLPDGSRLVVGVDSQALEQIDHVILSLFVGAFLLVVLIGVVAALWIGGYLRRRIEQVSLTAEAIMAGDIRHRVPVSKRGDEFDHLGGVLNRMLERIGRADREPAAGVGRCCARPAQSAGTPARRHGERARRAGRANARRGDRARHPAERRSARA
ncbi:HAMP domain-containing protein, partial [Enterobacter hormaechei]|nr:HAMP domain-containing protein [Enterobacter hormaechei]